MSESEFQILTPTDIQDFIQHPQEEPDMFGRMAGSIVSGFEAFQELPPDVQQELFNYLHTFSFIAFQEFEGSWRRTKNKKGNWADARDHVYEVLAQGEFPSIDDVTSQETVALYNENGTLKMNMVKATNTIFEMNLYKVYDFETLKTIKNRRRNNRTNHRADPPIAPGAIRRTNEVGPPSSKHELS